MMFFNTDSKIMFQNLNRVYGLEFGDDNVIQIRGNSGAGKTLLAQDILKAYKMSPNSYEKLIVFNYSSLSNGKITLKSILKLSPKIVVIDNADLILSNKLDLEIAEYNLEHKNIYWILIGRRISKCLPDRLSLRELTSKYNEEYGAFFISTINREVINPRYKTTVSEIEFKRWIDDQVQCIL